jgi:ABC-type transport system involved in cytochrome bd biosynthesis fused ATPase/permease subunit
MNLKERWNASKERNAAAVGDRANRLMADTHYDWLRTRRARVALVVGYVACLGLVTVCYLAIGSIAGIVAVLLAICVWVLLRLSVRTIADLPEEYLDERQAALRNAAYVEAYQWLGGLMGLLASGALVAFIVLGQDPDTWSVGITWNAAMAIFWVVLGMVLALPSLVLALRSRI